MRRTDQARGATIGSLAAGAMAGMAGGVFASWLMVAFQSRVWPTPQGDDGEPSTRRLARRLADLDGGRHLTDDGARKAGTSIHYLLGGGLGLLYGATAEIRPEATRGAGLPFGIATETVIDQAIVPLLGLSNPFWKCPPSWHLRGLAAHLVFGLGTEISRSLLLGLAGAAARRPRS